MTELGILLLALAICTGEKEITAQGQKQKQGGFQWIEKQEAFEMMKKYSNYRIVDVRSREEYMAGHLPKALNIPVDEVEEECKDIIPSLNQVVFVYCSSGTRSRKACEIMAELGYTNVYGFGGFQK